MSKSQPEAQRSQDEEIAHDLAWKLLDDRLDEEEAEQLSILLLHSEAARRTYVQVVQMHVGLLAHFGALPSGDDWMKKLQSIARSGSASGPPAAVAPIATTEATGT